MAGMIPTGEGSAFQTRLPPRIKAGEAAGVGAISVLLVRQHLKSLITTDPLNPPRSVVIQRFSHSPRSFPKGKPPCSARHRVLHDPGETPQAGMYPVSATRGMAASSYDSPGSSLPWEGLFVASVPKSTDQQQFGASSPERQDPPPAARTADSDSLGSGKCIRGRPPPAPNRLNRIPPPGAIPFRRSAPPGNNDLNWDRGSHPFGKACFG